MHLLRKRPQGIPLGPSTWGQVFSRPGATGASGRKRGFDASPSSRFHRLQHFPDAAAFKKGNVVALWDQANNSAPAGVSFT
jgi:hypothetical protein